MSELEQLKKENCKLRAKIDAMTRLGSDMADELQANYSNQQTRLMSMKWYKAVDSSNVQSLTEVKAGAVISAIENCNKNAEEEDGGERLIYVSDLVDYANKLRSES